MGSEREEAQQWSLSMWTHKPVFCVALRVGRAYSNGITFRVGSFAIT